jgi:pantoate--beta-alanine ligase
MTLVSRDDLWKQRIQWEQEGASVAFVPTMGALHEGHLSLVRQAKSLCKVTVASIFVNPLQFGPAEDLSKYPRTLKQDMELLTEAGCDAVFLPNTNTMYPAGFQTLVANTGMAHVLCGAHRPGHFEGVLTVVLKLFHLVNPHTAIFGKKDFQQLRLIERMVEDLCLPIRIVRGETVREKDGLAMSSRNRYLAPDKRAAAARLYQGLTAAKALYDKGERKPAALEDACAKILAASPELIPQYIEARHQDDLSRPEGDLPLERPAVLALAAHLDGTRLIDNIELGV